MTADQILKHPWIVGHDTPRKNLPATLDSIKKYKQHKLKGAGIAIMAVNTFKKLHMDSKAKLAALQ